MHRNIRKQRLKPSFFVHCIQEHGFSKFMDNSRWYPSPKINTASGQNFKGQVACFSAKYFHKQIQHCHGNFTRMILINGGIDDDWCWICSLG